MGDGGIDSAKALLDYCSTAAFTHGSQIGDITCAASRAAHRALEE
jgi:hypothetical protein